MQKLLYILFLLPALNTSAQKTETINRNYTTEDSTIRNFNKTLDSLRIKGDDWQVGIVLLQKGYYYFKHENFDSARNNISDALLIGKALKDTQLIGYAYNVETEIETEAGNYSRALISSIEVLKLYKNSSDKNSYAYAMVAFGNVQNYISNFPDALKSYKIADSIYKDLGLDAERIYPLNNIGTIYFFQNDYHNALLQFEIAYDLTAKLKDSSFLPTVKLNIGEVYGELKQYAEGEKWLKEAIDIGTKRHDSSSVYSALMCLARIKTLSGKLDESEALFKKTAKLLIGSGNKIYLIRLETDYGRLLYLKNDLSNAEEHLQASIEISKSIQSRTYSWKARATIAKIKIKQNKKQEALEQFRQAIEIAEDLKSRVTGGAAALAIFSKDESIIDMYQNMALLLKDLGKNKEALYYLEKSNTENLAVRFGDIGAGANDSKLNEKKVALTTIEKEIVEELSKPQQDQSSERIASIEQMQTILEADYQAYIDSLAIKDSSVMELKSIDADQMQSEMSFVPENMAVISYLVSNKKLSIFITMKDTLVTRDIPINKKLLEEKIIAFYNYNSRSEHKVRGVGRDQAIVDSSLSIEQISAELYQVLISPVMQIIKSKTTVAIVPTNLFSFLPFHALLKSTANVEKTYFGDEKKVFYVNTIRAVTSARNKKFSDMKIVAAGNADGTLANAATEVMSLHNQFPKAKIFIGGQATKKNVLLNDSSYNILHLATHGNLDYYDANKSYLTFAPDANSNDDGKLQILDINKLKNLKRFQMVTLSACETSVTMNLTEGWPVSTASAFLKAGVPTVIASLWKVDDVATAILMEQFYIKLKGGMDKVSALQAAQYFVKTKTKYTDANYWAPFQLVGMWE